MTKDLICFLSRADSELKEICASNLCICAEKFAPNTKVQIDTMIKVLTTAGNYVRDDVVGTLCQLISDSSTLHAYCVQHLWRQLKGDLDTMQPLVQVAMWCLGEYGDLINEDISAVENSSASQTSTLEPDDISPVSDTILTDQFASVDEDLKEENNLCQTSDIIGNDLVPTTKIPQKSHIDEEDIIEKCRSVLTHPHVSIATREYTLCALFKLSVRYPNQSAEVKRLTDGFTTNLNIELQQRSIEFSSIFSRHEDLMPAVFERMPPMEKPTNNNSEKQQQKSQDSSALLDDNLTDSQAVVESCDELLLLFD